jgi:hypothetical protein
MSRWTRVAVAAALLVPAALRAQGGTISPQCPNATVDARVTQDACQKSLDLFQFLAPQLGATLAGGNAVLGEHSALRGVGHFSLGIRANVINAAVPRVGDHTPALTGATSSSYGVENHYVPVPTIDGAIGIFRGFPVAGTNALALDALVNVAYIPNVKQPNVSVSLPDGSLKLGFGGRLGLLQETFVTPGVSITYLQRDLPSVDVAGRVSGDQLDVRNIDVHTKAWRVVAGKNLALMSLSVGAGQDRYETSATSQVTINRLGASITSAPAIVEQSLTRLSYFADVSLNFALLRIVGELGRVSGGTIDTYNSFAGSRADDAHTFGSLGVRVNW